MMGRALGDADTPLAIATPGIRCALCPPGGARVIVASDGLWDELSARAALKFAHELAPDRAASALCDEAKARGTRRKDVDDVAVVVVDVDPITEHAAGSVLCWDAPPGGGLGAGALRGALRGFRAGRRGRKPQAPL